MPVLVIEDEREIQRFLKLSLEENGYKPVICDDGRTGLQQVVAARPDLIILDLGLPDIDGQDIITNIREWSQVPIIVLSARDREKEKVAALENGADDYLTKPFSVAELLARMQVALRHAQRMTQQHAPVFSSGALIVDLSKRLVMMGEDEIRLTPIEYKLLTVLIKHAGRVVTYSHLMKEIWGKNSQENGNYLRIHMQHLRRKLGDDALHPQYLATEPGIGYRFKENSP